MNCDLQHRSESTYHLGKGLAESSATHALKRMMSYRDSMTRPVTTQDLMDQV